MLLNKLNDKQLTKLLSSSNEAAFTEIYTRYWQKLLAIAFNHTKDKSASEEILQEVFISLWNRRNIVHVQSLSSYLATAVKFSIFKQYHRDRRRKEIEHSLTDATPTQDEAEIDARFLKEYIDGVVEQLPEKCRMVFKCSRESGMTIPEISQELNIAEKTVESHLTKALKTIRHHLKVSGILNLILSAGLFK